MTGNARPSRRAPARWPRTAPSAANSSPPDESHPSLTTCASPRVSDGVEAGKVVFHHGNIPCTTATWIADGCGIVPLAPHPPWTPMVRCGTRSVTPERCLPISLPAYARGNQNPSWSRRTARTSRRVQPELVRGGLRLLGGRVFAPYGRTACRSPAAGRNGRSASPSPSCPVWLCSVGSLHHMAGQHAARFARTKPAAGVRKAGSEPFGNVVVVEVTDPAKPRRPAIPNEFRQARPASSS